MAGQYIVDDSDPSVSYSSGWQKAGGGNEFNGTTSWTNQPGRAATISFVGVQIQVFGTIGPRTTGLVAPQSNYVLDGTKPAVFIATQNDQSVQYQTKFYQSPIMKDPGRHTLTITNILNSDNLFIDYFLISPGSSTTSSSSSSSSSMVTVTSSVSSTSVSVRTSSVSVPTTSTVLPTTRSSESPTPTADPSSSNSNTATIVGSAFAAAVIVIGAVALILCLRNRKRRRRDEKVASKFQEESAAWAHTQYPSDPRPAYPGYPADYGGQEQSVWSHATQYPQQYPTDPPPAHPDHQGMTGVGANYVTYPTQQTQQHGQHGPYDPYGTY